jgi:hypothetical protein
VPSADDIDTFEKTKILPLSAIEPEFLCLPVCSLVTKRSASSLLLLTWKAEEQIYGKKSYGGFPVCRTYCTPLRQQGEDSFCVEDSGLDACMHTTRYIQRKNDMLKKF